MIEYIQLTDGLASAVNRYSNRAILWRKLDQFANICVQCTLYKTQMYLKPLLPLFPTRCMFCSLHMAESFEID